MPPRRRRRGPSRSPGLATSASERAIRRAWPRGRVRGAVPKARCRRPGEAGGEPVPRLARQRGDVRPGVDREVPVSSRETGGRAEHDLPGLDERARDRERERRPPRGRRERDERRDRRGGECREPEADREPEDVDVRCERGREARRQVVLAQQSDNRHGGRHHGQRVRGPEGARPDGAPPGRRGRTHAPAIAVDRDRGELAQVGQPPPVGRVEERAEHLVAALRAVVGRVARRPRCDR